MARGAPSPPGSSSKRHFERSRKSRETKSREIKSREMLTDTSRNNRAPSNLMRLRLAAMCLREGDFRSHSHRPHATGAPWLSCACLMQTLDAGLTLPRECRRAIR